MFAFKAQSSVRAVKGQALCACVMSRVPLHFPARSAAAQAAACPDTLTPSSKYQNADKQLLQGNSTHIPPFPQDPQSALQTPPNPCGTDDLDCGKWKLSLVYRQMLELSWQKCRYRSLMEGGDNMPKPRSIQGTVWLTPASHQPSGVWICHPTHTAPLSYHLPCTSCHVLPLEHKLSVAGFICYTVTD